MNDKVEKPHGVDNPDGVSEPPRRNLLKVAAALVIGGLVSLVPLVPGLAVLVDPLLRKKKTSSGRPIRITTLEAVPADGLPHRFQVVDTRVDKWNAYPAEPIDAVFLIRDKEDDPPRAFSVICPHLGCAFDFKAQAVEFQCPCHTSGFALDGSIKYGPSPRPLDTLDVEIRNENEVWIVYRKFKVGKEEKVPV